MAVKAEDVLKDLKNNQYSPIYFLTGDESYFIDQISDYIENNALTPPERGFNQTIAYGKDVPIRAIVEKAKSFPMGSKRQVIIVKEAQDLQDIGRKEGQEMLSKYCKAPMPSTVLVFNYKHKKLDGRSEIAKTLQKHSVFVDSKKMYDDKVPIWIKNHCKEKGHKITERASIMMAEFIGNNITRISNEIVKLLLNYEEKIEINEDLVLKHIGISKEFNAFELQTALAYKDVLKANQIINYFAANPKDNPIIPTISLLFNYFSKVLMVHQNRNEPKDQLAKMLKVHPFFIQEYFHAAKNHSLGKTTNIIHYIHLADLQSKGVDSLSSEPQILKELIYKILH
ncbi:MAG: DNA polymerase III subunit delta [Flammeovirgaceae bacterium]|nr:DNA polymerase III subunit delta [Flammeovirgaceae bacterium]